MHSPWWLLTRCPSTALRALTSLRWASGLRPRRQSSGCQTHLPVYLPWDAGVKCPLLGDLRPSQLALGARHLSSHLPQVCVLAGQHGWGRLSLVIVGHCWSVSVEPQKNQGLKVRVFLRLRAWLTPEILGKYCLVCGVLTTVFCFPFLPLFFFQL